MQLYNKGLGRRAKKKETLESETAESELDNEYHNILVNGYIAKSINNHNYPTSIIAIFLRFLGNLLIRFDTYPDDGYIAHWYSGARTTISPKLFVKENNTVIDRGVLNMEHTNGADYLRFIQTWKSPVSILFGCSKTFFNGINIIRIKTNQSSLDSIGIINDISVCKIQNIQHYNKNSHFKGHTKDCVVYMLAKGGECIVLNNVGGVKFDLDISENCKKWNSNDIIQITVNYNNWTMQFAINDKQCGETINIAKDNKYYLIIESKTNNVRYEIL
eukprot:344096_1